MKIIPIPPPGDKYSCWSYLLLGDWNAISDVNTLIDTGADERIVEQVRRFSTGVGKVPVERVILTHSHFDHTGGLARICQEFHPEVCAFLPGPHVTRLVRNGEALNVGDSYAEVIHLPAHSEDSIALYCPAQKAVFTGDSPLTFRDRTGRYVQCFLEGMERLARLPIETIFAGHDPPLREGAKSLLEEAWACLQARGRDSHQ